MDFDRAWAISCAPDKAHARRGIFEARDIDPERVDHALVLIGKLYKFEEEIRTENLTNQAKLDYRQKHAKPVVQEFFEWVQAQFDSQGLLPASPFTEALNYVREREIGLSVYLDDPDVAIDTNHLERALRPIPISCMERGGSRVSLD